MAAPSANRSVVAAHDQLSGRPVDDVLDEIAVEQPLRSARGRCGLCRVAP